MQKEATFRIFAGDKHVDIKVVTEGFGVEQLLEIAEGDALHRSVFLREPRASQPSEIRSFLTAMRDIAIVQGDNPDARVEVFLGSEPSLVVTGGSFRLTLPPELLENPRDRRRTLAGNLGFLYSLSLYLLEKKHQIVSYHSSALVDEHHRLIFINGGDASCGKSVIMLDYMAYYGMDSDSRVLSTEMGHFRIADHELVAYGGSRFDNVSLFPKEAEKAELMHRLFPRDLIPSPDADSEVRGTDGSVKTAVSVKDYYARQNSYSSREGYRLVYLMPAISPGNIAREPSLVDRQAFGGLLSSLIGVARQKLGQKQPSWIYDEKAPLFLPAWFLASEQEMEARTIEQSLTEEYLRAVVRVEGNPIDFNRAPGALWRKIVRLLELE